MAKSLFKLLGLLILAVTLVSSSPISLQNVRNGEYLDNENKIWLNWTVDAATQTITFELEADTSGYVGFGISPNGGMAGADIFIAGVYENGTSYHSDRHGTGRLEPIIDNHPDWVLIEARTAGEFLNKTYLKFSRLIDTCDDDDYPIGMDTTRIIWALGATDTLEYHTSARRGSKSVNLLGAPMPELDTTKLSKWDMTLDMVMPSNDTAYWCSFHKGPKLHEKHQIVAFDAFLPSAAALAHTHHFILYNCYANDSTPIESIFENYTVDKFDGDLCYKNYDPELEQPIVLLAEHCKEYLYVWAKGGKRMVFPENVGYPIGYGDQAGKELFYMLEIHYDNPDEISGLQFEAGVTFYYTNETREHDAGQIMSGHDVTPSITVPPNTTDFVTVGHCGSECTAQKFPTDGIKVFNALLHSHLSGRKLKLRHFRNEAELPWIDFDDHYDFDYQQNKHLNQEIVVLPGDHLTFECTYDSWWKKGRIVIGDLSTEDEMCQSFIWYYPKIEGLDVCASGYDVAEGLLDFGITNFTAVETIGNRRVYVNEPEYLRGDYEDSLNTKYQWTEEFKLGLEEKRRNGVHDGICMSRKGGDRPQFKVSYPKISTPYQPESICGKDSPGAGIQFTSSMFVLVIVMSANFLIF